MDRAPEAAGKGYFPDAVAAAGLSGEVTFHSLRHLYAVTSLLGGRSISEVSAYLGHSSIELTVKQYGRFSVDVHVRRLRKALSDANADQYIQTVRGAGYRFSAKDV